MVENSRKILALGGAGAVGGAFVFKVLTSELVRDLDEIVLTNYSKREEESVRAIEDVVERMRLYGHSMDKIDKLKWKSESGVIVSGINFDLFPKNIGDNPRETPLYELIKAVRPWVVFNSMPSATALSYTTERSGDALGFFLRMYLGSLHNALGDFGVNTYLKIGTTGVGGMGFNIPFSHGEEGRPSQSLQKKKALGAVESEQYRFWSRDPTFSTRLIELKPGAAIGFDKTGNDKIRPLNRGKDLDLSLPVREAMEEEKAIIVCDPVELDINTNPNKKIDWGDRIVGSLSAPYLRSGENGQLSRSEWLALTRPGMMELISCEDVAEIAVRELSGKNTGYNYMISGREISPRYSAASIRDLGAKILEDMGAIDSCPIFLNLGPERLSKLISEAYILREALKYMDLRGTLNEIGNLDTKYLRDAAIGYIQNNPAVIKEIVSVGIPIYTGDKLITGSFVAMGDRCVTHYSSLDDILKDGDAINRNAMFGWVDLREDRTELSLDEPRGIKLYSGLDAWRRRAAGIVDEAKFVLEPSKYGSLGSMIGKSALWLPYIKGDGELEIEPGEIAGWVFENEEGGERYHM